MSRRRSRRKRKQEERLPAVSNPGTPEAALDPQEVEEVAKRFPEVPQKVWAKIQTFAGPIPPPALLAQYEAICPGSADRIITQFEEQSRHRRTLEKRVVWHNIASATLGQITGFVLFVAILAGGVFLIYNDKSVEGIVSIVTAVGGAGWVLRKAETARRRELQQKRQQERRGK